MKKWICGILSLVLVLSCTVSLAAVRMPVSRGSLTDDADVLSGEMSSAIVEYIGDVENETDVNMHVAIVHFLDGLDAQTYAKRLFEKWELGKEDVLLLCAAGEDSFATAMGKEAESELGKQNMDNLLYTSSEFAAAIAAQEYDAAFARYFVAFNELANKRYEEQLKLPKVISRLAEGASAGETAEGSNQSSGLGSLWQQITSGVGGSDNTVSYVPDLWSQTVQGVADNSAHYHHYQDSEESNGIGVGGWIILIILILIIFSQSHPARKAKRNYRSTGGRKPLGWLFALFGLSALVKLFRK